MPPVRRLLPIALLAPLLLVPPAAASAQTPPEAGSGVLPVAASVANSPERPVRFAATPPAGAALAIPVAGPDGFSAALADLPAATAEAIRSAASAAGFAARPGKTLLLRGIPGWPAVLLVGVVPSPTPLETTLADFGGAAAQAFRDEKAPLAFLTAGLPRGSAPYVAFGATLGQYRYDRLKSSRTAPPADPLTIVSTDPDAGRAYAADLAHLAHSIRFARDLVTAPSNIKYPQSVASAVESEMRGVPNVRVTVLDEPAMRALNMGSLLGVGQGSRRPSRLVAIEYRGAGNQAPLALVGKGITFDSGGISIKPAAGMWEMKGDMSGAAATLAAMARIVREKPAFPVSAFLCLAENMPDSRAQRPGDIYRARNGKSIHVDNTDAEGRLVLADVLTYAAETGATHIVDLATLTGACIVALGEHVAGAMGRHEAWTRQVRDAGQAVGEEIWPLPLHGEYRKLLDHPHADINNIGGRWGGAITAGIFLSEFVPENVHWVHLDIAGPAMATGGWRCYAKGFTGFGTRTLIELARGFAKA